MLALMTRELPRNPSRAMPVSVTGRTAANAMSETCRQISDS